MSSLVGLLGLLLLLTLGLVLGIYVMVLVDRSAVRKLIFSLFFSLTLMTLSFMVGIMIRHSGMDCRVGLSGGVFLLVAITMMVNLFKTEHRESVAKVKKDIIRSMKQSSEVENGKFYGYLTIIYVVGAFSNLMYYYTHNVNPFAAISLSVVLVALGMCFVFLLVAKVDVNRQNLIITTVICITIPLVLLVFLKNYASNIVWPLPLLFLLIPVVLNSYKMYVWVARVSTLTLIVSWIILPMKEVPLTILDYFSRLVVYILCIIFAYYINRTYIQKITKINHQIAFDKLVSDMSVDFLKVSASTMDHLSNRMLEKLAKNIGADRGYIVFLSASEQPHAVMYHWVSEHKKETEPATYPVDLQSLKWFGEGLTSNQVISVKSMNQLPVDASCEKDYMMETHVTSMLLLPIVKMEKVIGFIGFEQIGPSDGFYVYDEESLKISPNIYSEALLKVEAEKELQDLAYKDYLTGLPNRGSLLRYIDRSIVMADKKGGSFGLVFLDLDGFKMVNDSLGHNWGDVLLYAISERLKLTIREGDFLARVGGDEFVIVMECYKDKAEVLENVANIVKSFERPFNVEHHNFYTTISAGVVMYPKFGQDHTSLMKYADIAMYEAKSRGKNQFVEYCDELNSHTIRLMTITNDLYTALEKDELFLVYQPQMSLVTNEIIGFEALLRWNHPRYGFIPPDIFISIAERNGLISEIGEWVILEACRQNKEWQDQGFKPVRMAVNISTGQIEKKGLKEVIASTLAQTGLEAHYLELEITEGIALKQSQETIGLIQDIKTLGVMISIDDFGTEFSTLKRLRYFLVDRLKIDMQFIRGIGIDPKDEAIINVLIYLARSLDLSVIAEGVETQEQLDFLINEGCEEVQGYYFYKPMLPSDIEKLDSW